MFDREAVLGRYREIFGQFGVGVHYKEEEFCKAATGRLKII
jgi:hypothetical protein